MGSGRDNSFAMSTELMTQPVQTDLHGCVQIASEVWIAND